MLCVLIRMASSIEDRKDFPKLSPFASWPGAMINPHWLELPMSRINFMVPKMFEPLRFYCMYMRISMNISLIKQSYRTVYRYTERYTVDSRYLDLAYLE